MFDTVFAVPEIAIAKQMNGPFSKRVKKERERTYIHISHIHTHIQKNTHTHTRTGRLPAFNIIHKERKHRIAPNV